MWTTLEANELLLLNMPGHKLDRGFLSDVYSMWVRGNKSKARKSFVFLNVKRPLSAIWSIAHLSSKSQT
jgi:hypothetical protein